MTAYNHIVVGAGISGMTSALLLAKQGYKVALVESFPLPGPTVRGFSRQGVHFETGIHLIGGMGDGDPLDTYFKHLDISDDLVKIPFNEDGCDCFRFEKRTPRSACPMDMNESAGLWDKSSHQKKLPLTHIWNGSGLFSTHPHS